MRTKVHVPTRQLKLVAKDVFLLALSIDGLIARSPLADVLGDV
jgi:hypothetical protein